MTTADSRLGALEGRADEQGAAIAELRSDIRDLRSDLREGLADVRSELRQGLVDVRSELRDGLTEVRSELAEVRSEFLDALAVVNGRIDRLYLAVLTVGASVGAAQVGLLVAIILRT